MTKNGKYYWLVIPTLVLLVGIGLFIHVYRRDMNVLTNFVKAYQLFDVAVINRDVPQAQVALTEMQAVANTRISSAIKNDSKIMKGMPEITTLAMKELNTLKSYNQATARQNAVAEAIAEDLNTLKTQRQTAFAGFMDLAK